VTAPVALAPGRAGDAALTDSDIAELLSSAGALRGFLDGLPGVDSVGLTERAATLRTRSIKRESKLFAIDLAISMLDLTTLEGKDTHARVRSLCRRALHPDPTRPDGPRPAAVCVYPDLVATARDVIGAAGVAVASVATGFPAGRTSLAVKVADTFDAVAAGADEIDMVIDRGAFLAGDTAQVAEEIVAVKQACRRADDTSAHLKVILETGELATYDNVRRASWLAMIAGADFIKTSTGKVTPAATLPVTLVMLQAVRDFRAASGRQVGVKAAGGIRTSKDAIAYLVTVNEIAGPDWLSPRWFRFGASSLLDDLIRQSLRMRTGGYVGADYVARD
jgi:deoxyribose-phosphate aldolase